jgi:hypothetical protein
MSHLDPYHRIGLRRNPFLAPESLIISNERWLDFGYSVAPLPNQRLFIQVIGQKGVGKTSHLVHWHQQTGGEYFYQPPWNWQLQPPVASIAYWDEANRIALHKLISALHQAYRQHSTIVAASHWNLKLIAQIVGFPVKTLHLSTLTPDSLQRWIQIQLAAEQLPEAMIDISPLSHQEVTEVVAYSQGSWRTASSYLHRWVAKQARSSANESLRSGLTHLI